MKHQIKNLWPFAACLAGTLAFSYAEAQQSFEESLSAYGQEKMLFDLQSGGLQLEADALQDGHYDLNTQSYSALLGGERIFTRAPIPPDVLAGNIAWESGVCQPQA